MMRLKKRETRRLGAEVSSSVSQAEVKNGAYVARSMDEMQLFGLVRVDGYRDDGTPLYAPTNRGRQQIEHKLDEKILKYLVQRGTADLHELVDYINQGPSGSSR